MRLPNVRLACVLLATLVASACAGRRVPLPADPGSPLVDLVGAYARVADICQGTRTMTAELALSGRVGQQRIRGRVLAGFAQPDAMRLEGLAPFGAPAFILVSRGGNATLVLPREEAVLRSARPEQVLEALTGVALAPQDLFTVLSGCVTAADPPVSGTQHAGGWATITLRGGTVLFLKRVRNAWELRAARRGTLLIEYPDVNERRRELARLIGVEDRMFIEVEGHARVYAIADEDLDRETEEKTSAVHFVRFEFDPAAKAAIQAGAGVKLGCDHTHYPAHLQLCAETLASLAGDLK